MTLPTVRFEKITLWTAVQTYGAKFDHGLSALDYIMRALDNLEGECQILDYDGEDYKLVKLNYKRAKVAIEKGE